MSDTIFTGCIPALMTPCTAARKPDFDALVAKGRELIDIGMSAVVYCGSMGDWPLLTEAQRQEGVARLAAAGVRPSSAPARSTAVKRCPTQRMRPRSAPRG